MRWDISKWIWPDPDVAHSNAGDGLPRHQHPWYGVTIEWAVNFWCLFSSIQILYSDSALKTCVCRKYWNLQPRHKCS